jgi:hypothetical protein
MKIDSLYRDYIQKSRLFLYPLLNIKRGFSVTPVQTYISWENHYEVKDNKLIAVYHLRNDTDYTLFEEIKLKKNPLFHDCHELENGELMAYVFDFGSNKVDFQNFAKGRYSKLSPAHKKKVLNFFKGYRSHHAYIESYLYPKKYFTMYSELLMVERSLLEKVGELCSKPDIEQEKLKMGTTVMNLNQILIDLQK